MSEPRRVVVQKEADGLKESSEVRSFMSAATNVNLRDPVGAIRAITASAIGAVTQVRGCPFDALSSTLQSQGHWSRRAS